MGEVVFTQAFEGAGLSQVFLTLGGTLNLFVDVAAVAPVIGSNDAGFFQLLLDGTVRDSFDVPSLSAGEIRRHHLAATVTGVSGGSHTFAVLITRPFASIQSDLTPRQYFTNADVEPPVTTPEPSTLVGAVIGLLMVAGYAWRRRRAPA